MKEELHRLDAGAGEQPGKESDAQSLLGKESDEGDLSRKNYDAEEALGKEIPSLKLH